MHKAQEVILFIRYPSIPKYKYRLKQQFSENGLNIIKSAKLNFVDLAGSER